MAGRRTFDRKGAGIAGSRARPVVPQPRELRAPGARAPLRGALLSGGARPRDATAGPSSPSTRTETARSISTSAPSRRPRRSFSGAGAPDGHVLRIRLRGAPGEATGTASARESPRTSRAAAASCSRRETRAATSRPGARSRTWASGRRPASIADGALALRKNAGARARSSRWTEPSSWTRSGGSSRTRRCPPRDARSKLASPWSRVPRPRRPRRFPTTSSSSEGRSPAPPRRSSSSAACPGLRILVVEKTDRFDWKVGESTVEISAYFLTRVLKQYDHLSREQLPKQAFRYWFVNDRVTRLREASEVGPTQLARTPSFQLDRSEAGRAPPEGRARRKGARSGGPPASPRSSSAARRGTA